MNARSEKRCPHCGQWSEWSKQPLDRCLECGELLDPSAATSLQQEADRRVREKEDDFFRVRETDGLMMRVTRKVLWVGHVIFAAIAWAVMWLVSSFSG